MSEGNSFLEEARARAASRAAVLQSLELAYSQPSTANQSQSQRKGPSNQKTDEQSKKSQDPPKQSNKKRPLETAAPAHEESLSSKVQVDVAAKVVVDSLQTQYYTSLALQQNLPTSLQDPFSKRPNYDRMGEFFKDNLQGKAIVLENTASQSKASKTEARLRRQKNRLVQLSNRQAKASKLVDCYARPPMHEMRILHQHWLYYVRQIIGKDVSMLSIQLQAKFLSLELKGAKVVVVQHVLHPRRQPSKKLPGRSKDLNYTGVTGYITHATSSSYYIMPDMMISADSPKHEQDVLQALNSRVVKLERDFCDLAIILPRMQQKYRIEQESKEEKQKSTEKSADMEKTESDAVNRDAVEDEEEEVVAEEEDVVEMVAISEKDDLIKSDDTSYSSGPMLMLYGKHLHPHAHVAAGMAAAAALASGNNNGNNAVLVGGSSLTMSLHKSVSSCATKLVLK